MLKNIIQPLKKKKKILHKQQREWTLRTVLQMKSASHRRTGIAWFHSSDVSKRAKHIESGPGLGRGRDGALIYNKLKVLVMQDN